MTSANSDDHETYMPRHPAEPSWRTACVPVDLRPVRERVEAFAEAQAKRAAVAAMAGRRKRDPKAAANLDLATRVRSAGQAAVALLLGGTATDVGVAVRLASGKLVEIRSDYRGFPFRKWAPGAKVSERSPIRLDAILCVSDVPPFCYERVYVAGWLPRQVWLDVADTTAWGWRIPFREPPWRRIEEIMADELSNPELPIGAPGRRSPKDPGLPAYQRARGETEC